MNKIRPPRLSYIDIARGLAIIAVIASHTGYLPLARVLFPFINAWMLPVFAISGGMLFKPDSGLSRFILKKIQRLLLPYILIFFLSLIGWLLIKDGYSKPMLGLSSKDILNGFLYGQGLIFNGPLWFLTAYFLAQVIAAIISPIWINSGLKSKIVMLIGIFWLFISISYTGINAFFSYDISLLFLFYILLGRLLMDIKINAVLTIRSFPLLFLPLIAGLYFNGETLIFNRQYNYPVLFILNSILASLLIYSFAKNVEKFTKIVAPIKKIGEYSLILMSTHWPIMQWMTFLVGLTGVLNYANTIPTSTNFFIPSPGPSLGLSLIRISLFSIYLLVPLILTIQLIELWLKIKKKLLP